MKSKKCLAITLVMFFLVVTPFVFALENEFVIGEANEALISGNVVFTIEEKNEFNFDSFSSLARYLPNALLNIKFVKDDKNPNLVIGEELEKKLKTKEKVRVIVKTNEPVGFAKNLESSTIVRETPFTDTLSVTGEVIGDGIPKIVEDTKEVMDKVSEINEPVKVVMGLENFSISAETSFSRAFSMTGKVIEEEIIAPKDVSSSTRSEGKEIIQENKLFLDVKTSDKIEVKQIVDEYQAIEVDRRDFNQLQREIDIGEVIIDEPFSILTEESLEITLTKPVHDLNFGGEGVKICVIDTGVNFEVLGLTPEIDVLGYNVIDNNYDYRDDNGHGTNVMSVLTSFAPDATYYMVKALDENGQGYSSDIVAGLDWCFNQEVDIYSLSIGTGSFENYCPQDFTAQKVNEIVNAGFPVFVATGNQANKKSVYSPACSGLATPVAASTKEDTLAEFSNYNKFVKILAPGQSILVMDRFGEIVSKQGTSLSTPMVAGVAALILDNKSLNPQDLETLFVKTGEVIKEETREFSRINAMNSLQEEFFNTVSPREYPTYEELLKMGEEVIEEEQIFETLATCETSEECLGYPCIEGICELACNSTFDGDRCSDDENTYYGVLGGTCSTDNGGPYSCDKDEVSVNGSRHFTDCMEVESGIPTDSYECDRDVDPAYSAEGVCSWDGTGSLVADINCDLDEVCINSGGYYAEDCSVCGYTGEYSCDSNVGTSYTQDGICVQGGVCDTVDVCYNGTGYYGTMTQCSDGDECDSNVNPGFSTDGKVCNSQSLGCVATGSRTLGQTCCVNGDCSGDNICTSNVCVSPSSDCTPLTGDTFSIKNSTGSICFEVNSSGNAVIYGDMIAGDTCDPPATGSFEFLSGKDGTIFGWVNSTCYTCFNDLVYDSQGFGIGGGSDNYYLIQDVGGSNLMALGASNVSFAGKACYDYNSGSPVDIGGS